MLVNKTNLYEQRRSGEVALSRSSAVILVVSPLISPVDDQIEKINDSTNYKKEPFKKLLFDILYLHPEACLKTKAGFNLF